MTTLDCWRCGHPSLDTDAFCESCGSPLVTATARRAEQTTGSAAAVSDVGLRRERNEDAFALASSAGRTTLVVCDGVASTPSAGTAASLAARTVLATLTNEEGARVRHPAEVAQRLRDALAVAQRVVSDLALTDPDTSPVDADESREGAPSTTCVAAVVTGSSVQVVSLGDSRAYWLPDSGEQRLLTIDDSEAGAGLSGTSTGAGGATPLSRRLTRWIGADDTGTPPRVHLLDVDAPGVLLLCSDGLWQYFDGPGALSELLTTAAPPDIEPLDLARRLVAAAVSAGGGDNITAAVLPLRPSPVAVEG